MATADFELLAELRDVSQKAGSASPPIEKLSGRIELQDRIAFFLFLRSRISRACESWSQAVEAKPDDFSWKKSNEFSELYRLWLKNVEPTVSKLSFFEQAYGRLEGAEELRASYRDVSLMSLDTDRVKGSIDSLLSGQGIPFDSAIDQLRANLR